MGKSLKDIGRHHQNEPQVIMRKEMAQGFHKDPQDPDPIGTLLSEQYGPMGSDVALKIIEEHGEGLVTGIRQWQIIQNMVEAAYQHGLRVAGGAVRP